MNPLDLGFLCSLDSLAASACLGFLVVRWPDLRLALAFGLCDAAASWAGVRWHVPEGAWMAFALAAGCAALLGRFAFGHPGWLLVLPVALSLDNLAAPDIGPDWVGAGLGSAAMALAGFAFASIARARLSRRRGALVRSRVVSN